ncbi:hypothetical protein HN51_065863 [Arachis hypogaea]
MEGGRYQYYAVRRGRVLGIYGTWLECKRQVTRFKNNDYKGFKDLDEAKAWLGGILEPPYFGGSLSSLLSRRGSNINRETSGKTFHIRFNFRCGVVGRLMNEGPFLHVEDMELLLMRACSSLHIGAPIFVFQENWSSEEVVHFAFTMVLPYNSRGLELVAHEPTLVDVQVARQEVSFAMLEKTVAAIGYSICDYNYHTVARMEEH